MKMKEKKNLNALNSNLIKPIKTQSSSQSTGGIDKNQDLTIKIQSKARKFFKTMYLPPINRDMEIKGDYHSPNTAHGVMEKRIITLYPLIQG